LNRKPGALEGARLFYAKYQSMKFLEFKMRVKFLVFFLSVLLVVPFQLSAVEQGNQSDILAKRGHGIVYQSTFEARANKIPIDYRKRVLRDGKRLQDMINALLINSQLAADARKAGYDAEQIVMNRMKLAAEAELAQAWLQHYVESQPEGDYEQLAREYYLLNQQSFLSPPEIDVSHILISTKDRPEEEAKALADSLSRQLSEQPSIFDSLVLEYSEDPNASTNKGSYKSVKKGELVKPFEDAAIALQAGEISSPVKTSYGYHLIRLDEQITPAPQSFEEVKAQLVKRERELHQERIKQDYLNSLTSLDVEMTTEALEEMVRRQTGENLTGSQDGEPETE